MAKRLTEMNACIASQTNMLQEDNIFACFVTHAAAKITPSYTTRKLVINILPIYSIYLKKNTILKKRLRKRLKHKV